MVACKYVYVYNESMNTTQTKDKSFERMSQSDMPRATLREAVTLAEALRDNFAGKGASGIDLAQAVHRSPTSSSWRILTGAAVAYGLTDAAYNASSISLTPLGRQIVSPTMEGTDYAGKVSAGLRPSILKSFFEKYNGNKLPKEEIAKNVLHSFGVPQDRTAEALSIVLNNAEYIGAITRVGDGQFLQVRPASQVPDISTSSGPSDVDLSSGQQALPSAFRKSVTPPMDGLSPVPVAEGRFLLMVPEGLKHRMLDDEGVAADWAIARTALRTFAIKYVPTEENKPTPDSGLDMKD